MPYSDSHCHLESFSPEQFNIVLQQMETSRLDLALTVGLDPATSAGCVSLARAHVGIVAGVGIHPWLAVEPTAEIQRELANLAKQPRVVAIGEIGLDYRLFPETAPVQKKLLAYQLSLAVSCGLPASVHCNEAHADMMVLLRQQEYAGLQAVAHAFVDSERELDDWLNLGHYIAIGPGAIGLRVGTRAAVSDDVIRAIPLNRLVTETDASAGPPKNVKFPQGRGPGSPARSIGPPPGLRSPVEVVPLVAKLAAIRGESEEAVADATTGNLRRLLRV